MDDAGGAGKRTHCVPGLLIVGKCSELSISWCNLFLQQWLPLHLVRCVKISLPDNIQGVINIHPRNPKVGLKDI